MTNYSSVGFTVPTTPATTSDKHDQILNISGPLTKYSTTRHPVTTNMTNYSSAGSTVPTTLTTTPDKYDQIDLLNISGPLTNDSSIIQHPVTTTITKNDSTVGSTVTTEMLALLYSTMSPSNQTTFPPLSAEVATDGLTAALYDPLPNQTKIQAISKATVPRLTWAMLFFSLCETHITLLI